MEELQPVPEPTKEVLDAEAEKTQRIEFWNSLPEGERVRIADWFAKQFSVVLYEDQHMPSLDEDTAYDPITGDILHVGHYKR